MQLLHTSFQIVIISMASCPQAISYFLMLLLSHYTDVEFWYICTRSCYSYWKDVFQDPSSNLIYIAGFKNVSHDNKKISLALIVKFLILKNQVVLLDIFFCYRNGNFPVTHPLKWWADIAHFLILKRIFHSSNNQNWLKNIIYLLFY